MPDIHLAPGEQIITTFQGNRTTYIKEHILLAVLGSVIMSGVLIAIGNPHAWTGVVGAVFAIAIRGFYVASEQLAFVWTLTNHRLLGPAERDIPLRKITKVRHIFSAAQVITDTGDKYLLRYQGDVEATKAAILGAVQGPK